MVHSRKDNRESSYLRKYAILSEKNKTEANGFCGKDMFLMLVKDIVELRA